MNLELELERLAALPPGWDSYGAKEITPLAIDGCRAFANSMSIVPTSEGGIQLEWHALGVDLEIEIAPDGTIKEQHDPQQPATSLGEGNSMTSLQSVVVEEW